MCGPKFCSMRISQDIRDEFGDRLADLGIPEIPADVAAVSANDAIAGEQEMAEEFREQGSQVYLEEQSQPQ